MPRAPGETHRRQGKLHEIGAPTYQPQGDTHEPSRQPSLHPLHPTTSNASTSNINDLHTFKFVHARFVWRAPTHWFPSLDDKIRRRTGLSRSCSPCRAYAPFPCQGPWNTPLLAEIKVAVGTADPPESLAVGLTQLAAIGERFLGHKKDALAARAKVLCLDAPYVAALTAAAKAIRSTDLAASGRSSGKKATQGGLDKKDGEAFHLLEAIIDAFEKAHDIDPTIPRLVPISMRRHFTTHKTKAAPAAEPAPPVT